MDYSLEIMSLFLSNTITNKFLSKKNELNLKRFTEIEDEEEEVINKFFIYNNNPHYININIKEKDNDYNAMDIKFENKLKEFNNNINEDSSDVIKEYIMIFIVKVLNVKTTKISII